MQGVPKSCTRCPEQDMERVAPVSNGFGTTTETFSNTISIPLAIAVGQRYINITRNAIGPKSGQKDYRNF